MHKYLNTRNLIVIIVGVLIVGPAAFAYLNSRGIED